MMPEEEKLLPSIVLCGYEQGGTTLLSEIFRANGYESGFECGVLMCKSPDRFLTYKPYVDMLASGWRIDAKKIPGICNGSFEDFYHGLFSLSFGGKTEKMKFFDKTPVYMSKLGEVLNRTDFIDKACVIHRDPRAVFTSWAKRLKNGREIEETILDHLENFCRRYLKYFAGCIAHINNPNVLWIPFEELCLREDFYYKVIGSFLGDEPFRHREAAPRFSNVEGKGMVPDKAFEFEKHLGKKAQNKILDRTRLASLFFSDAEKRRKHIGYWIEEKENINNLLEYFDISYSYTYVEGLYFEPVSYLIEHPNVLRAKINPIEHFRNHGCLSA